MKITVSYLILKIAITGHHAIFRQTKNMIAKPLILVIDGQTKKVTTCMVRTRRALVYRWLLPVVSVVGIFTIRLAIIAVFGDDPTALFAFLIPPILSGWYGGLKPGLVATVLSAFVGIYFFSPSQPALAHASPIDVLHLTVYLAEGTVLSLLFQLLHDGRRRQLQTASALRASEDALTLALNSAKMATWDLDLTADRLVRSARHDELFGYQRNLLERPFSVFLSHVHPDDRTMFLAQIQQIEGREREFNIEFRVTWLDGSVHWLAVHGTASPASAPSPRIAGVTQDITAKKLAEERLRQQLHLTETITNNTAEGLCLTDANGLLTYMNPAARRILGWTPAELLGQNFHKFVHAHHGEELSNEQQCVFQDVHRGAEVVRRREDLWRRQDGSLVALDLSCSAITVNGHVTGSVFSIADITLRKETEAERDRSKLMFERIANTTPDLLYVYDPAGGGRNIFRNGACLPILGYTPQEFESLGGAQVSKLVHPDDVAMLLASMARHAQMRDGTINESEYRIRHKNGDFRWIRTREVVFSWTADGHPGQILGLGRDVTDRKDAEAEMLRAIASAEAASLSKSAFLANVSHEIRTPLGAVIGFAELLKTVDLPHAERLNYLEIICRNGQELACLIEDILDLSKVEAGRIEIERVRFSLSSLLADVATSLSVKAREKAITLVVETIGQVPDSILSDVTRLRQVLLNIIGNGIKFTEFGTVSVRVEMVTPRSAALGVQLRFTVQDTGRGISAVDQTKLFQPFAQADASTTRKFGGTGLGLILSRQLARLLGGDVVLVSSTEGVGSIFAVTIDSSAAVLATGNHVDSTTRAPQPKIDANDSQAPASRLSGIKILVAEDSPDNQLLMQRLLAANGAKAFIVANGDDAVTQALTGNFDLVLMDIQMPILDGLGATERLRARGYSKPIIALTAHAMQEERDRCFKSGCDDHISKPISPGRLLEVLSKYAETSP